MVKTIDMQDMRYLNLFEKITHVSTRFCFKYNEMIMFGVPRDMVLKAIGPNSRNLKKIHEILGKRIRVIQLPSGIEDLNNFVKNIISPVEFKEIEINEDEVILNAGSQNKAALIGRNKRRLNEMREIISDFFGKEFKII